MLEQVQHELCRQVAYIPNISEQMQKKKETVDLKLTVEDKKGTARRRIIRQVRFLGKITREKTRRSCVYLDKLFEAYPPLRSRLR